MSNFSTVQIINAGRSRTIGGADSLLILRDVVVTNGMGLKSKADATSDDIAITLADNGGLSTFQIKDLGTNNVMVVDSDGNVDISGNLNVTGSIVSRDEERVLVADNFLDINFGHVSTTALSGGIAVNYVSTAAGTNKSIDTGSNTITFTAVAGVARPKLVAATGSAIPANTYVTNDIVQISGTLSAENDGFYVVSTNAVAGTIEFLSTVKTTPDTINFKPAQVNFTGEANTSGTVTISKVKVTVLQVKTTDGTWETATGDIDGDFSSPGDLGGSTLQEAYDLGATILTDASGPIIFNLAADAQGLAINGSSAGDGIVSIGGTTAVHSIAMNASGAASSITATTQTLSLSTTGNNELDITSGGALDLNGAAVTVDGSGGVALAGEGAASSFTSDGQTLTVQTINSGTLAVSSAGALTASGQDNSTINITGTTKTLDVDATGAVSINSSAGIINIGDDAIAQPINIGTAGVRTVTVGADASTKVVVNAQSAVDGIALQVAGVSKLMVNGVDSTIESQYSLLYPTIGTAVAPSAASALLLANASGAQLDKGKIVALNASGQLQLADANGGSAGDSVRCPVGAPLANIGDGAAGAVGIGGMVPVFCADASHATNANRGKPVYLTDAGAVSTIAPASSGDTVFQVGILQAQATGTPLLAYVLWQPMFVADIT
jgi:hypothetical protein